MTKRTVVIRKNTSGWQSQTKRKNTIISAKEKKRPAGFISPVFIVLACTAFSGLFYVYSVNQTAIKGVAIRNAEKQLDEQRKANESLKIKEAELKSLYSIENATRGANMVDESNVKYLEENPAVAYNTQSAHKN